ncbi:hypothetical protein B7P43_G18322 [Cryptotermes secundus]|uniref:Uncharacterized protein n=1 Tax=Cryptotermes secundus TaxID=105785 RepID=A0A2J7PPE9_9NEOP|nr:hypothetical protein B7P43_G18322 [Cryptotermes secundus]
MGSMKRGSNWQVIKSEMWEEGLEIGDMMHVDLRTAEIRPKDMTKRLLCLIL